VKTKNAPTAYSLHKITNSIIKWTAVITSLCLDKVR
jgi:hypothetical protein